MVEDEEKVSRFVARGLKAERYAVDIAIDGNSGLDHVRAYSYDLIILDLNLPGIPGTELLKHIRKGHPNVPVLILSARDQIADKVQNFELGADDYLTKPFSMGELFARLRAALRRAFGRTEVFKAGELRLDFYRREVFVGNEKVKLTATEYDLLKLLATHAGAVRTHYQLVHELWGSSQYQDVVHLLRVTVSNLRRKLECDAGIVRHIVTEPGVGYRLRDDYDCFQARESL